MDTETEEAFREQSLLNEQPEPMNQQLTTQIPTEDLATDENYREEVFSMPDLKTLSFPPSQKDLRFIRLQWTLRLLVIPLLSIFLVHPGTELPLKIASTVSPYFARGLGSTYMPLFILLFMEIVLFDVIVGLVAVLASGYEACDWGWTWIWVETVLENLLREWEDAEW